MFLQRLKQFENRRQLIQVLGNSFRENQTVDFAGCYRTHEPGVSHKQRIQTITHDIWKATGYRFTVKDHPRAKDGHKTRLWCSQDESHKSKPSKVTHAPRIASDGMAMAKTRYPCRSGLLISSRDDKEPDVSHVIVRMHHHLAHEPYYDHTLPPEMTQSIWQNLQKPMGVPSAPTLAVPPCAVPPSALSLPALPPTSDLIEVDDSENSDPGAGMDPSNRAASSPTENPASVPPQEGSIAATVTPELFQQRMRKYIADIRDFCCGLEYQLQFNDYKLLEVLESEGSQFLRLVHQCLESEGRLQNPGQEESSNEVITHVGTIN
ncbi:hypothetical protein C0995_004466 [Termitomyces sp. Mi166|nr:hypothetical protein C0995_004466 [Termitomyces sp. Mi166\